MRANLHELDIAPSPRGLATNASDRLRDALLGGTVDLISAGPLPDPGIEGFAIYTVNIVAFLPDNHPLAGATEISVEELEDQPLLLTPTGYLSRTLLDKACTAANFEATVYTESHNASTLVALVEHGAGIAVLADDAAPYLGADRVSRVVSDHIDLGSEVWLYRNSTRATPAQDAFMKVARDWARPSASAR
jgi:DNA-binding transcriptional LysR family regulator